MNVNSYSESKKTWDWFATILFLLVFGDALITYFTQRVGFSHVAAITGFLFLIYFLLKGPKASLPNSRTTGWLLLFVVGFSIAVPMQNGIGLYRLLQIASAGTAFLVGFVFFKTARDEEKLANLLLFATSIYLIICLLALYKIAPGVFPLETMLWSNNGVLNERPSVMTDQNFQVFYLFPVVLLMALPFRLIRGTMVLVCVIGSLLVLAKLQTRSGVLIISGLTLLAIIAPFKIASLGRRKIVVLPAVGILIAILILPLALSQAGLLLERFSGSDGDFRTLVGRLHSFTYLFENLWNPMWWLPRGNNEFVAITGNTPHSNATAMFLEGGILGLLAWFALLIVPLWRYFRLFRRRQLDNIGAMLMLAGIGTFVMQMTLNVPVMDQVWLWMGAMAGGLTRMRLQAQAQRASENSESSQQKAIEST